MRFAKAHAYGNDFLYVHQSLVTGVALDRLAVEMCDRHTGVGADGLILYTQEGSQVPMRLLNADGSDAEVSGNGVRALGALVLLHAPEAHAEVTVQTAAGPKHLARLERQGTRQLFRSAMGLPRDLQQVPIDVAGETVNAVVLSFGNPQCVVVGPLPDAARFARLGAALERHDRFPNRTNVEFAQVESPGRVRILIWERGCGPTQSSGTGSCASLVAAAAFGGASRSAEVVAPGGAQQVEWTPESVYLTGWAEVLCEGEWLRPLPRT
ncbi:MAG: diaminopimelate epimerase [Vicinamibacterales bacterium]